MINRSLVAALLMLVPGAVQAQVKQTTGQLEVKLLITSACEVSGSASGALGTALLDFGTSSLLLSAIDADTGTSGVQAVQVLCNPNVTYSVAFDAGQNATQVADRAMRLQTGTGLIKYQLYSDAARNTVLTSVSGTGTGSAQAIQVFGRVPPQAAPAVGNYRDVVTITVTF